MYCNTVLLEAIENFIVANKRYVLNLCTAILHSWRVMKYCGGHNLPTNNVNTVTLFLMYRVIRISCLLRAILAELRSGASSKALGNGFLLGQKIAQMISGFIQMASLYVQCKTLKTGRKYL